MTKKLYVGNLSYQTNEDTLRNLFAEFGGIESVNVITDRYTGRSKGFAFVEMDTDSAAQDAIGALNGKMVDDREISVAEARPQKDRPRGDRRGGGDRGGSDRGGSDRGRSRW
jgi:cold-inducible RNA-binding protein